MEAARTMTIVIGKLILLVACLLFFAPTFLWAQDSSTVTELDPSIAVAVDLPKRFRFDLYAGKEKSDELASARAKIGLGVSFRVKPIFKRLLDAADSDKQHLLVVGAIYEYSRASEEDTTSIEHRLMLDATLRYDLPKKLLLSNRNRFEFRWVNGDYHLRYRNRPALERSFKLYKRNITPYVASELFWDQRYKKLNIYKFTSGVQVPVFRRTSVEFFYERQYCSTCATRDTNIFGLNLNFYFHKK